MYAALARYNIQGNYADLPRSGRPRVSSARDDRLLVRESLHNRRLTVPDLTASWNQAGVVASASTVRRRLKDVGLTGHVAQKKPMLTQRHRNLRLTFARHHATWTWVDWSAVLWTDESRFTMFQSDGPTFVRRRAGEQLRDDCVVPTVKFNGGGIMMWGAMSYRGTGLLTRVTGNLNAVGYIDILGNSAVPSAHFLGYGNNFWLQDDGAPCHRARIVHEWKNDNGIQSLLWPPQSPDLNPIENLWWDIKKALRTRQSANLNELEMNVKNCWGQIAVERCEGLVKSMPRRIQAVLAANGGYTKY